jgi:hypothetical protein
MMRMMPIMYEASKGVNSYMPMTLKGMSLARKSAVLRPAHAANALRFLLTLPEWTSQLMSLKPSESANVAGRRWWRSGRKLANS